jgi:hypothetical protein
MLLEQVLAQLQANRLELGEVRPTDLGDPNRFRLGRLSSPPPIGLDRANGSDGVSACRLEALITETDGDGRPHPPTRRPLKAS